MNLAQDPYNAYIHPFHLCVRVCRSFSGVLCCTLARELRHKPHVCQVRWDTEHGFHVPELLCKDCDSLEDMIKVRV